MDLMKKIFLFTLKDKSNKTIFYSWQRKIGYFNLLNFLSLLLGLILTLLILPSIINFFITPFILLYFIIVNIIYTLSVTILIVINNVFDDTVNVSFLATLLYILWGFFACIMPFSLCMLNILCNLP